MKGITILAIVGAASFATGAGAQVIGTPKPGAPPPKVAKEAAPVPALNTVAVYPFGSQSNGTQDQQAALAQRGQMAFQASGVWTPLDRSADPKLMAEIEKIHSPEQFRSEVKVCDECRLNARFILWGYLEQARLDPPQLTNGQQTYNARLDFVVQLSEVGSARAISARTLSVSSIVTNRESMTQEGISRGLEAAGKIAARKLGSMIGGKKNPREQGARETIGATSTAVLLPTTKEEALQRAYENAYREMLKWSGEIATQLGIGPAAKAAGTR